MHRKLLVTSSRFTSRTVMCCVILATLFAFGASPAIATTYYVKTNGNNNLNGLSLANAWSSINRGDVLGVLNAGDTVQVQAGTYSTQGADGAYIRYRPGVTYIANGAAVIDQAAYTSGTSYGFRIATTGITVGHFEIKNAVHGVKVEDNANSCIVYNTIHDGRCANVDASGVWVAKASSVQVSGNLVYNYYHASDTTWTPSAAGVRTTGSTSLLVLNNTFDYCHLGVFYYSGTGGTYGTLTVKNNIVENCPGYALVNPWCTDLTKWTISHQMLYSNGINYGNVPEGASNLLGYDPRHVNRASHDYTLASNSAAVNGGLYVGIPYNGPVPDIGAYESSYTDNSEASARHFVMDNLAGTASQSRPWTFYYNGQWFYNVQANWTFSSTVSILDANRTQRTLTYTDPTTGLRAQCVATEYLDYPAVDWVVNFTNTSGSNTPMLTSVESMHTVLYDSSTSGDYTVYHAQGCNASITDFQPFTAGMNIGAQVNLKSTNGKSSEGLLPFVNIMRPDGNGVVSAIGWTGQWQASFTRTDQNNLVLDAGMIIGENLWGWTNTYLLPSEQIRTPSQVLVWWSGGDKVYGHNKLRSLILAHYSGVTSPPVCTAWPGDFNSRTKALETACMDHLADGRHATVPVQTYVIDAGWFHYLGSPNNVWEWSTGNWDYCDPTRFASEGGVNGLRVVSNHAHSIGYNFGLWVEPERCQPGTDTYLTLSSIPPYTTNALLAPTNPPGDGVDLSTTRLVNLGDAQALAWLEGKINSVIGDYGVDMYRQDMNARPIYYWVDGANRAGIKQIKYITGLYAFLDYLKAQKPNLIIDNCAGGGKRIDIEMLKRSFTLTRGDGPDIWNPTETQCGTYGLAQWIPLTGMGSDLVDDYKVRSGWGSHSFIPIDWGAIAYNDPFWNTASTIMGQLDYVKALFRGDFYPCADTPYSTATNVWMAWQVHRSDLNQGLLQVFRRPSNTEASKTFHFRGLNSSYTYRLYNSNTGWGYVADYTGSQLMTNGLQVNGISAGGSAAFKYVKL
ncbi:MAG: alpha-galactosidase [Armatimonadota bacterium]